MEEAQASWRRVHQAANVFESNVKPISVTQEEFTPKVVCAPRYDYGRRMRDNIAQAIRWNEVDEPFSPIVSYQGQKPKPSMKKFLELSTGEETTGWNCGPKKVHFRDEVQVRVIPDDCNPGIKKPIAKEHTRLVKSHHDTFGRVLLVDELEENRLPNTWYQTVFKPKLCQSEPPAGVKSSNSAEEQQTPSGYAPISKTPHCPKRGGTSSFKYTDPAIFPQVPDEPPSDCTANANPHLILDEGSTEKDDVVMTKNDVFESGDGFCIHNAMEEASARAQEKYHPKLYSRDSKTRKFHFPDLMKEAPKHPISETREELEKTRDLLQECGACGIRLKYSLPGAHTELCTLNRGEFPFATDGYVEPCTMRNIVTGAAHSELGPKDTKSVTASDYCRMSCHRAKQYCCPDEDPTIPWSRNRKPLSLFVDLECPRRNGIQKFLDDDFCSKWQK